MSLNEDIAKVNWILKKKYYNYYFLFLFYFSSKI